MKKLFQKILVILLILVIITSGVFLIRLGVKTYNKKPIVSEETEKNNPTLEELNKQLEIAEKNISDKITELERLKDEKNAECDKIKVEQSTEFTKSRAFTEKYYEIGRRLDKCNEIAREYSSDINALKKEVSLFSDTKEIKNLIDLKKEIEEKIEKAENPNSIEKIFSTPTAEEKEKDKNETIGILEIAGGVIIILVQILGIIKIYNKLVKSFHKVENSFANIDVFLKKRWDLIPNLIETVKGYSKHESATLEKITKLRNINYNDMNLNEKVAFNNQVSGAISKIMVLQESYPELKANEDFLILSKKLSEIEDDIATSRIVYNDSVMRYNNIVKVFPNNILVVFFEYKEIDMFQILDEEKEVVKVNFK